MRAMMMPWPTIASWAFLSSSASSASATSDADWDGLSSQLSSAVKKTNLTVWMDQCIKPFDAATLDPWAQAIRGVPNYWLFEQESGLCMQTAACSFESCRGPFAERYTGGPFYNSSKGASPILTNQEILDAAASDSELPEAVVHPVHPGDVSNSVKFAAEKGMQVSVKTSGHNWMGASTKNGTLLLNLAKLKKFALPETLDAGIFKCDAEPASTNPSVEAACKLAKARGKPAVMRAGGGQIVDEGLQTVETWNQNATRPQLHLVCGAAGTVALGGGWLSSGGLAGTLGVKKYGAGVDQVLHLEMVLPDGRFVRFGPSAWDAPQDDQMYPQTSEVTGFCNTGDLSDESKWSWSECSDPIAFDDLWYAVRGGGGGNFGIITSVYYQLHDKPGSLQIVHWSTPHFLMLVDASKPFPERADIHNKWFKFLFQFLFAPGELGVPANISNSCSQPDVPVGMFCYSGAGQVLVDKWAAYSNGEMKLEVYEVSSYASLIGDPTLFQMAGLDPSMPGHPWHDRVQEFIPGGILAGGDNVIVFPIDVIRIKMDTLVEIVAGCYMDNFLAFAVPAEYSYCAVGSMYVYGGAVEHASDGMDSYAPHRRNGAIHIMVIKNSTKKALKKLFWDVPGGDEVLTGKTFPGILCHNHLYPTTSPRKSNWLEECDYRAGGGSDQDCMSLQEASWGTATLHRLEEIHASIDPLRTFQTVDGPGYAAVATTTISGSGTTAVSISGASSVGWVASALALAVSTFLSL